MKCPIYEMSYLWNVLSWNVLFMKCFLWTVPCIKCPIYEKSYLWNVPSMKCPIYEMSYLWNVPCIKCPIYKMSQHLNFVLIINCSSVNNFSVVLKIDHIFTFLLRPIKFIQSEEKLLIVLTKRSVIQYLVQWNP